MQIKELINLNKILEKGSFVIFLDRDKVTFIIDKNKVKVIIWLKY